MFYSLLLAAAPTPSCYSPHLASFLTRPHVSGGSNRNLLVIRTRSRTF